MIDRTLQVDEIPKDAVVFISQPAPHIGACYGDLASLRAKHLGAAGAIIAGSVRDLQEHRDFGLPASPDVLKTCRPTN